MNPDVIFKESVGRSVMGRLIDALSQNAITQEDAREAAQFLLDRLGAANNNAQVLAVLEELCQKWPIFEPVLISEKGELDRAEEEKAADETAILLKENKIDEAIEKVSDALENNNQTIGGIN